MKTLLLITAIAAATASTALAAPPSVSVVIRHQMHGCHAWSVANGPWRASQTLTTTPGARLTVVDNDVMPHVLLQVSGPKTAIVAANMHKPGATATVQLPRKGTYVFKTRAGEDYMAGVKTVGADNVLRMVVIVR